MKRKPSAELIRRARNQMMLLDPDVQELVGSLLDGLEPRKQPGRPKSETKPRRDTMIVLAYDQLLTHFRTLTKLARDYEAESDHEARNWCLAWRRELPQNDDQRFEEVAKRFHLSESTITKIVNKHLRDYRDDPLSLTLGKLDE